MKRKTVKYDDDFLGVCKGGNGMLVEIRFRGWVSFRYMSFPPHKLREFGQACIKIADEVAGGT